MQHRFLVRNEPHQPMPINSLMLLAYIAVALMGFAKDALPILRET